MSWLRTCRRAARASGTGSPPSAAARMCGWSSRASAAKISIRSACPISTPMTGSSAPSSSALGDIGDRIEKERWVLRRECRPAGDHRPIRHALPGSDEALQPRLSLATWQRAHAGRLKLRPLNADKPRYVALSAIAAPTSPFKQVLESLRDETQLTKERPRRQEGRAARPPPRPQRRRWSSEPMMRSAGSAPTCRSQRPASTALLSGGNETALGADIESQFKPYHVLVDGDLGRRPGGPAPADAGGDQPEPRHRRDQPGAVGGGAMPPSCR